MNIRIRGDECHRNLNELKVNVGFQNLKKGRGKKSPLFVYKSRRKTTLGL